MPTVSIRLDQNLVDKAALDNAIKELMALGADENVYRDLKNIL